MGINKESQRAVQGVREKIQKKFFSDKLQVSMTDTDKDKDERAKSALKVGEEYTDRDGKVWYRMESGGITNKTTRQFYGVPMFCPEKSCGKIMGGKESKLNSGAFMRFGYCYSCRLKFEKELKLSGKWDEYVKKATNENIKSKIRDAEQLFEEQLLNDSEIEQFVMNSSGELETWLKDKDYTEKQQNQMREYIDKLKEKVNKQE
tara:strand:- start:196 stop:807 length:612 start_codon:yes stop_codon:yes gene_type:complete